MENKTFTIIFMLIVVVQLALAVYSMCQIKEILNMMELLENGHQEGT